MKRSISSLAHCLGFAFVCTHASALEYTIDFSEDKSKGIIGSGQVIDDDFTGVTVSATGGVGLAVIYPSDVNGGNDLDLEFNGGYAAGNHSGTSFGNLLIVEENTIDGDNDGFIDGSPDDNAGAGTITFDFDFALESFSFGWVDLDDPTGYSVTFNDTVSGLSATVFYGEFVTPGDNYYDPTVVFGDRSANVLPEITAASLDDATIAPASTMTQFDQVVFNLNGEGAIGEIHICAIPEPSAAASLAAGAFFLLTLRRRR